MPQNIAIRLQAQGGAELRRELEDAGKAGEAAFRGVGAAADAAGGAADRLSEKTRKAGEAAKQVTPQAGTPAPTPTPSAPPTPSPTTQRELDRLRSRLDEEFRNSRALGSAESVIGRGYGSGALDEAERARLLELARARYGGRAPTNDNEPGQGQGLSQRDRSFIQYSAFSGASSLTAGASLGSVAVQQGVGVVQLLADREGGLKSGLSDCGANPLGEVVRGVHAGRIGDAERPVT